jgi:hypothetical protein
VFDNVKATIAKEVVLAYPDFTKPFEIYTDASMMQLGAVITQGNRPIAFFSRKLSKAQSKYSVTKIELLAIVETQKEFQGMLWGQTIKVYTDHKNLIHDALGLTSDRVYHWQLLLEEFAPEIVYIKGFITWSQMPFLDWITILRSTQLASLITPPLVYQQKGKPP